MSARTQVTLTQFETMVYYRLGNAAFWTSDEVRQQINAALRTWNSLTGYWRGRLLLSTVANVPYYALSASLVFGAHVEFNGVPITQGSVFGWDQGDPYWEASRGTPVEWSPVGIGIIATRPVDPIGRNSLLVDGVTVTSILTNGGDYIDIAEDEFRVLVNYVQHLLVFKEGGAEFNSTLPFYKDFIQAAGIQNEKFKASALYRRTMGLDEDKQQKVWRTKPQMNPVGVR